MAGTSLHESVFVCVFVCVRCVYERVCVNTKKHLKIQRLKDIIVVYSVYERLWLLLSIEGFVIGG